MNQFEAQVTGGLLIVSALMLWLGWVLLPAKIGAYFEAGDFAAVNEKRRLWIWLYRLYLFGYVVGLMAVFALATLVSDEPGRIVVWPAVGVLSAGFLMTALAYAFYYHFGAWGALDMDGQSGATIADFIGSLRVSTEYVTCLVRFGRVFIGVGQLALVIGLSLSAGVWPIWLLGAGGLLGLAGMGLTMGLPDNLALYQPVFHLNALWLAALGAVTLTLA
mgnify:CR=1 FL=1